MKDALSIKFKRTISYTCHPRLEGIQSDGSTRLHRFTKTASITGSTLWVLRSLDTRQLARFLGVRLIDGQKKAVFCPLDKVDTSVLYPEDPV